MRSGRWSRSNRPSEMAPSIVTQASRSVSIRVALGSIQGRWAWAAQAMPARARAMANCLANLFCMACAPLLNRNRHRAQLFLAGGAGRQLALGGPGEGHAHQFAAARFARR